MKHQKNLCFVSDSQFNYCTRITCRKWEFHYIFIVSVLDTGVCFVTVHEVTSINSTLNTCLCNSKSHYKRPSLYYSLVSLTSHHRHSKLLRLHFLFPCFTRSSSFSKPSFFFNLIFGTFQFPSKTKYDLPSFKLIFYTYPEMQLKESILLENLRKFVPILMEDLSFHYSVIWGKILQTAPYIFLSPQSA
jgi:hypothetical protein